MKLKNGSRRNFGRTFFTVIAATLLITIFFSMVHYIYQDAEQRGFDELRRHSQLIKEDVTLQMLSDQENLLTLARMASSHHNDESGFKLMIESFKAIGLIDNIAFLMPDDTLITRAGVISVHDKLSFHEEVLKGAYISGRVQDVTNPDLELVRSAVPVLADGKTIAMLYGTIKLDTLAERYAAMAELEEADLYLLDRKTGDFIIDTFHDELGNIKNIQQNLYDKDASFQQMLKDIEDGHASYIDFKSLNSGERLYFYYMPLDIGNWQIMLSQPETILFAEANSVSSLLILVSMLTLLVMILYALATTISDRRQAAMIEAASRIRKLLIEINQHHDSILTALESITLFAKSRSAFFVNEDGEDYNHIIPVSKNELLVGEDRRYFLGQLKRYASEYRKGKSVTVVRVRLDTNTKLRMETPDFYEFLKKHNIKCVCFVGVFREDAHTSLLGVINPGRNDQIRALLSEIAVCFSMAIYNKDYLNKTEASAVTDSLTGLSNRLAYKRAITAFDNKMSDQFSCVYVDVNELHIINNKLGHAAGDEILLFVSFTLRQAFPISHIFRIGGDEFLVFSEGIPREDVLAGIETAKNRLADMNYHVSIGMDFRSKNIDTEAVVKEAEKRMYEEKAEYYQQREHKRILTSTEGMIPAGHNYVGVYAVSLKDDRAYSILESRYLKQFSDHRDNFSKTILNYVQEVVKPEYHRGVLSALKYDVLKKQLCDGRMPSIAYSKINGERIILTICALPGQAEISETIWLFERDGENTPSHPAHFTNTRS